MGGLGSSRKKRRSTTTPNKPATDPLNPQPTGKSLYEDDDVRRMPLENNPLADRAGQQLVRNLRARSGRSSTRLVGGAGTVPYQASLMGSTS